MTSIKTQSHEMNLIKNSESWMKIFTLINANKIHVRFIILIEFFRFFFPGLIENVFKKCYINENNCFSFR